MLLKLKIHSLVSKAIYILLLLLFLSNLKSIIFDNSEIPISSLSSLWVFLDGLLISTPEKGLASVRFQFVAKDDQGSLQEDLPEEG